VVTTFVGSGASAWADGAGAAAAFFQPSHIAFAPNGNLMVADFKNSRLRMVTQMGMVTTVAGGGKAGFLDGLGTASLLNGPVGVAVDASGTIYVGDYLNNRIRRLTCSSGPSSPSPTPMAPTPSFAPTAAPPTAAPQQASAASSTNTLLIPLGVALGALLVSAGVLFACRQGTGNVFWQVFFTPPPPRMTMVNNPSLSESLFSVNDGAGKGDRVQ